MACCRCNRTGSCRNCRCVKTGNPCQGCLPQRLGKCVNTVHSPPSEAPDEPTTSLSPTDGSTPMSDTSSSLTPPNSTPELLPTAESSPAQPEAHTCDHDAETPPPPMVTEPPLVLPDFVPASDPTFSWGSYESTTFITSLNAAYNEVVHWKPNFSEYPKAKPVNPSFWNWPDSIL